MVRATQEPTVSAPVLRSGADIATRLTEEAGAMLRDRLRPVEQLLPKASENGQEQPRLVHQLRVATRRAAAALTLFESCLAEKRRVRIRKALRRIRRAAGESRQAHVHVRMIRERRASADPQVHPVLAALERAIARQQRQAQDSITKLAQPRDIERLKQLRRRLLKNLVVSDAAFTLADAARRAAAQRGATVISAEAADLANVERLHELRLAGKRLRYLLEIVETQLGPGIPQVRQRLENMQDRLGAINDLEELACRIESIAAQAGADRLPESSARQLSTPEAQLVLAQLATEIRKDAEQRHHAFLDWWRDTEAESLRRGILDIDADDGSPAESEPSAATVGVQTSTVAASDPADAALDAATWPRRIAAIDVGTNSIRLVIAEVHPDRRIRIIDDERAVTRLGRGLNKNRRLAAKSMNESVLALQQFKAIAEGYRVDLLRAVATCAVREARNGRDFVAQVQRIAGLDLQVISPQTEARLAFTSVSNAFDLRSTRTAVIDLGGGSTEIILGSGHLIEQVYSLPVGAIRLTEKFRLDDEIPADRYRRMRQYVRRMLKAKVGRPPFVPHHAVGTGGTFTTLAAMSMQRGANAKPSEFLPFNVRGYELQRSELKHILDQLRGLSLNGRLRVPGLGAERADIIVAGLATIDVVLKHLQVNTLRVHDQGIRAGLLQSMVDELLPPGPSSPTPQPADRLRAVRQFATSCNFEQEHSDQVARLSMMIFDLLARELGPRADAWATPENREMLHAAALLHDVGYFINYSRHHKHSYHLVMHSDLPAFTHRQREIIANVGRYHRGAEPKKSHANFARLDRKDRALVRTLSAILRVADGLDRSHTSNVRSLEIRCHEGVAFVRLATQRDATVDVWGAMRKSALFEEIFDQKIRFSCAQEGGEPDHPQAARDAQQAQKADHPIVPGNGKSHEFVVRPLAPVPT